MNYILSVLKCYPNYSDTLSDLYRLPLPVFFLNIKINSNIKPYNFALALLAALTSSLIFEKFIFYKKETKRFIQSDWSQG